MTTLNKKEYQVSFEKKYIEEYCNLQIYPYAALLEKEAGLLSDFAEVVECTIDVYGENDFLKDNLRNFKKNNSLFKEQSIFTACYIDNSIKKYQFIKKDDYDIVLCEKNSHFDHLHLIEVNGLSKKLYLSDRFHGVFKKKFHYYFSDNGIFNYDNLICYTMIIKNGGPLLEQVLTENLPIIDRWCILDTGSTDGSQDVIKRVLKNKKGKLHEEPFVNFKVSRNRCLELAGHTCKFILMLDDTYSIRGDLRSFLNEVRGDQFSDSFSLLIQSDDTEYYSNRIIKSLTNLRYIHTIHEVISDTSNINVTVPADKAIIFDHRADYMEKRTNDRKQFDLQLLFKEVEDEPNDPRALYYIAQTYGCIGDEVNKAKYFEQRIAHPVQGYFQEKIDACFELARTYNFKIHPITKEPLTSALTQDEWMICEKLYLQAYSMDNSRPDGLYFIGIHYYLDGKYTIAYEYFKKAFEVGYPIGSQYSLKPTLSFHFLPKFLAEVCYHFSDFETGRKACELFLGSSKFNKPGGDAWNLMCNWYSIHKNLEKMPIPVMNPIQQFKIFCIVTDGGWENWTGEDILTKGLGGSETWIIQIAKFISELSDFQVVVFCKTDKPRFFNKVGYNPIEMFHNFIATNVVDYCFISRYTEYIPVALRGHAINVGIIFHDMLSPELILPVHYKLKYILGLTQFHANLIKGVFPQLENKVGYLNYGIDENNFTSCKKIKNSFIYSSFPNRGLVVLLRMWPKIIKKYPNATLNIFCNMDHEWTNKIAPEMMNEIKKLLKINTTGIQNHGWVSKKVLAETWNTTEFWFYPCIFEETFCLTALEAAISKTFVITNGLAALAESASGGLIIQGNPLTKEWQETALTELFKHMDNSNLKYESIEQNYNWAKELSWKNQTIKFLKSI